MSDTTENYLVDLGIELLALARNAQREAHESIDGFQKGRQVAYYEVLCLMKQQARAFGLNDEEVGLKEVDLEELIK